MSYPHAVMAWWIIGFACVALSMLILCRMLPGGWKNWMLVVLLMPACMPFFQAFTHGQNTFFSLFLLTATVALWRKGQSLAAGIVCGLLFYKPQLGLVVAVVLCLSQGRRALLGVVITGTFLTLVNVITLPGTLADWLLRMPGNMHWMQELHNYHWERHVTFKGFWRLLIQNRDMGPTAPSVLVLWGLCEISLLAGLAIAIWKILRGPRTASQTDRLIALSIVSMPLLMPFYFDYDLLLISVAAVVYAVDHMATRDPSQPANWEDRWLPRIWAILFVTLEFGTAMAGHTRFHPVVPLVTLIAVMMIRRILRKEQSIAVQNLPQPQTAPFAAILSPLTW
jgi:hypothetical protein